MKSILVVGILFLQGVLAAPDNGDSFNDDDVSCDPKFADACFGDVQDDLRVIFNPSNNYAQTNNISLLRDLCSAWNDSLSCTSDFIDDGCQESDGRLKFDHWNAALRKTFEYVCSDEDLQILRNLFHSNRCFNVSAFFYCVETTAKLKNIEDLLSTSLDLNECRYVQKVISKCGEYVTYGTCAMEVLEPVNNVLEAFLRASDCSALLQPKTLSDSSGSFKSAGIPSSLFVILLITVVSLFVQSPF